MNNNILPPPTNLNANLIHPQTKPKPSDEYYTPLEIVRPLGKFDLDPCGVRGHETADIIYTKEDDGLSKQWIGRVWLNPPYRNPLIGKFVSHRIASPI